MLRLTTKKCPFCREEIQEDELLCRFCGQSLKTISPEEQRLKDFEEKSEAEKRTFLDHLRTREFQKAHPNTTKALMVGYRLYRLRRRWYYAKLYRRFRDFTMLMGNGFAQNLALCDTFTVRQLPGAVVECGTWKGGMIAGLATMLGPDRHYYLFDSYEGLPPAGVEDSDHWGQTGQAWQAATTHNDRASEKDAREAMRRTGVPNVTITKGWFSDTLPTYSGGPIAILRADGDWYLSTHEILSNLFPHVVPGGIVILDDYYYWHGCAMAVHEFLGAHGSAAKLHQAGDYAYLRKAV